MTDADMSRPPADDYPKDPDHAPAVEPAPAGEPSEPSEERQGEDAELDQTGGQVANAYTEPEEGQATGDEQARHKGEEEPPA
jgi:hypothetical protein